MTIDTTARRPRRVLTQEENANLFNLLREVIEKVEDTGNVETTIVRYRNNLSDEDVAQRIAPDLKSEHVARLRRKYFGDIKVWRDPEVSKKRRFGDQLADLRGRVARLEEEVDALRKAWGDV